MKYKDRVLDEKIAMFKPIYIFFKKKLKIF